MTTCIVEGCPVTVEHADVKTTAARVGVTLKGDEGFPWHCDEKMEVRSGIAGPDFARCRSCGLLLVSFASPHINGGYIWPEPLLESHGDAMWVAQVPEPTP